MGRPASEEPSRAWVATSLENAKSHIAPVGPWRSTGPVPSIVPFRDATVGEPQDFLHYTPKGADLFLVEGREVWTGTRSDGTINVNGDTCEDWTKSLPTVKGGFGDYNQVVDGRWTDVRDIDRLSESRPCSERHRLYCFEQ
jgi:hypothetical protein